MTIKVVHKRTRLDAAVNWFNRDNDDNIITPITINTGSETLTLGEGGASSSYASAAAIETPDNLTQIITRTWDNFDVWRSSLGPRSVNSAYNDRRLVEDTYNEDNNITVITYVYDENDNLLSRRKRIGNEWVDYSE